MNIEKIKSWLYKTILIILLLLVLYVTYCSIFNIYGQSIKMKPIVIMLGVITCIFVFIGIKRLIGKIGGEKANYIALGISILFFLALSFFGNKMMTIPYYDLSSIQKEVQLMLENAGKFVEMEYFKGYTNQVPMAIFIYFIYKIGEFLNINNLKLFATIINSLFMATTAFFTYLSIKKLKDYKLGLTTLIFFVINPIFYLYASYFYSDTLSMPFAAISLYLFIIALKSETIKKRIILLIFSGLILAIGFKVRVVLIILLIAMIIGLLLDNKFSKKIIGRICCLIIGFIIGVNCFNLSLKPFNIPYDRDKEIPITHWIKLSLNVNSDGGYIQSDFDETVKDSTYEEKIKSNLNIIKKRLSEMGLKGWVDLSQIKLARTWSNGDYKYVDKLSHVDEVNSLYEYIVGNKRIVIIYYCQIMKATMLIIFLVSLAKEIKRREKEKLYSVVYIAMFGAFLFYMIWEVLSRYSLTFLPWMILVFGIGISQIEKMIMNKRIEIELLHNKLKVLDLKKVSEILLLCVFGITLLLMIINYYPYAIKKDIYSNVVILQDSRSYYKAEKVANKKIEQTFKTSNKFNAIYLSFYKNHIKSVTNYKLTLYDSEENIIYQQMFNSDYVKHFEYTLFVFNKVVPNGEEEYKITITSNDATEKDTLLISRSYQNDWNPYPDGIFTINDKEIGGSISFVVQNIIIRTYLTKGVYITICIVILLIEMFAFYPFIKKKEKKEICRTCPKNVDNK